MYLNCHSWYSFKYGTLSIDRLSALAESVVPHRLTLTDINTMSGCIEFAKILSEKGLRYNLGVEFRRGDKVLYVLIARDETGFAEINAHLSQFNPEAEVWEHSADESFSDHVLVIYPLASFREPGFRMLKANEYVGVAPHEVRSTFSLRAKVGASKLIALPTLTFLHSRHYSFHKVLRAIDQNKLISRLCSFETASPYEYFHTPAELELAYSGLPDALQRTRDLSESCDLQLNFSQNKTFASFYGSPALDCQALRNLAYAGITARYGALPGPEVYTRVDKELEIITRLAFGSYFLVTHDFVSYALSRGYYHVGRGSGANSIVAYCLGITDVDPITLDLYFERFLNASRNSPPDFDIDFSWKERDEIIQYILNRYNKKIVRASLLATTVRFRNRSVIRELGKVYGLPKLEIDRLVSRLPKQYYGSDELIFDSTGATPAIDKVHRHLIRLSEHLHRFPSHLSIHAGGILISEAPLHTYTATYLPPKGFPTAQIDMFSADDIQLYKWDVLSQRGLGHIRDTIGLVAETRGIEAAERAHFAIHQTSKIVDDSQARALLRTGDTIGCFYIESPAMRGLLKKMRCDDFLSLTAASSVIRPGVGHSGMMRAFISRFRGEEVPESPHPKMTDLLQETFGVMIYQEDVIKVAHHFAGLSLEEADVLRRGMSGKLRSREMINKIKDRFMESCREIGYEEAVIQEVWRQMESFSGYTFPKAHSASFAVESFQDLYLKHHFPLEFMCAVVNNFGGFYSTYFYLNEARRLGARILLPCVNASAYLSRVEGRAIRLGFVHIGELNRNFTDTLLESRKQLGPFASVYDFVRRVPAPVEQLAILIRLGGFDFTGKARPELLWEARIATGVPLAVGPELFAAEPPPPIQFEVLPYPRLRQLYIELEYFGFPVSGPVFELLAELPENIVPASAIDAYTGRQIRMTGYICAQKPIKTRKGGLMQFLTLMDPQGGLFDAVLFPQVNATLRIDGAGPYLLEGRVTEDFEVPSLDVTRITKLEFKTPE